MEHDTLRRDELRDWFARVIRARATGAASAWLDKARAAVAARPPHANTVLGFYSGAGRRVGKSALTLALAERAEWERLVPGMVIDHWGLDEAARAWLLLSLTHLDADAYQSLAHQAYELGDSREQEGWLRALVLLPACERFRDVAIDACRTNIKPLFEAIACENPYPARHFPELNFNQLVLKSLFMGVEVMRISALESRLNAELSRMANDFASEREAAGRPVPVDIWIVIGPHADAAALNRLLRHGRGPDPLHRANAAAGLGLRGDDALRTTLEGWKREEREPKVIAALDAALHRLDLARKSAAS